MDELDRRPFFPETHDVGAGGRKDTPLSSSSSSPPSAADAVHFSDDSTDSGADSGMSGRSGFSIRNVGSSVGGSVTTWKDRAHSWNSLWKEKRRTRKEAKKKKGRKRKMQRERRIPKAAAAAQCAVDGVPSVVEHTATLPETRPPQKRKRSRVLSLGSFGSLRQKQPASIPEAGDDDGDDGDEGIESDDSLTSSGVPVAVRAALFHQTEEDRLLALAIQRGTHAARNQPVGQPPRRLPWGRARDPPPVPRSPVATGVPPASTQMSPPTVLRRNDVTAEEELRQILEDFLSQPPSPPPPPSLVPPPTQRVETDVSGDEIERGVRRGRDGGAGAAPAGTDVPVVAQTPQEGGFSDVLFSLLVHAVLLLPLFFAAVDRARGVVGSRDFGLLVFLVPVSTALSGCSGEPARPRASVPSPPAALTSPTWGDIAPPLPTNHVRRDADRAWVARRPPHRTPPGGRRLRVGGRGHSGRLDRFGGGWRLRQRS